MVSIGDGASAPPPPSDATALDFDLPEELIQDAVGRILCVVCKVYVPRGQMNASQHLGGKRHAAQAQRVPRDLRAERRAELLEKFANERAAAGQPPLAQNPSGSIGETARTLERLTSTASESQKPSIARPAELEASDKHLDHGSNGGVVSKRVQRIGLLKALSIDRSEFLSSVLDSENDTSSESDNSSSPGTMDDTANTVVGQKASTVADRNPADFSDFDKAHTSHEGTDTLAGRTAAFSPVNYKAPAGASDFFMDSMADEESGTDKALAMREILSTKSRSPGSTAPRAIPKDVGIAADPGFLSLERSALDEDDDGTADAATLVNDTGVENGANVTSSVNGPEKLGSDSDSESPLDALPPWLVGEDSIEAVQFNPDSSIALHYEILEFERFVSPTKEEQIVRRDLVQTVTAIVQAIWPAARVEVFGSYATDLYLPTSDIDICVLDTPEGGGSAPNFSEYLELAQAIRNVKSFARRVNFIKARVPLVKIVSRNSNVQCDISFNRGNGPANVPVIKRYILEYPALRPLLMVLKCFLQQRSLNEVFSGGLGSYSVLLLVVSHLQMTPYNFPGAKANLGTALHQFFHLYGRLFNYCLTGIRVKENGAYFDKAAKYNTTPSETLRYCIEDPNDETNELGRSSFAASRIRKAFGNAFMFLSNWRRDDPTAPVSPLSALLYVDDQLRERRATVVEDFTNRNILKLFDALKVRREEKARSGALASQSLMAGASADAGTGSSANQRIDFNPLDVGHTEYRGLASSGRNRPSAREPSSKRRRADNHREYDGGLRHQERLHRLGGHSGQMGNMTDSLPVNMYGQRISQMMPPNDQYTSSYEVMNTGGGQGVSMGGGHVYGGMGPGISQIPVDPYSGFAPDPRHLAQVQGLQYGSGHMGGWNGGSVGGQNQPYDPRYGQAGQGADFGHGPVPGQTWRHVQQGARGGPGGPSRGRPQRGGSRGGGRGSGRGRSRRGR